MLRKMNRILAVLLSFALVMSTFGHDFTGFTSIAADDEYMQEAGTDNQQEEVPAVQAPSENNENNGGENNNEDAGGNDEGNEDGEPEYQPEEPQEEAPAENQQDNGENPEAPAEDQQDNGENPEAPAENQQDNGENPEAPAEDQQDNGENPEASTEDPETPAAPETPEETPETPSDDSSEGSGEAQAPGSDDANGTEDAAGTASSSDDENTESAEAASSGDSIEDEADAAVSASSEALEDTEENTKKEKKDKNEDKPAMPARDFFGSAGGMNVSVHADEGAFPEGTEMQVTAISAGEAIDAAVAALGENVTDAIGVDISFHYDGNEIEPANAAAVHVNISLSSALEGESFSVVHKDDDGGASRIADASADGASFETGSFSIYIIAVEGDSTDDTEGEVHSTATYNFYVGDDIINTQIVKKGDTLSDPGIPELTERQVFHGWFIRDTESRPPFGTIENVIANDVINIDAKIETTYYLTFIGPGKEIVQVKKKVVIGNDDTKIYTTGVTATPTGETQAFIGWTTEADTREDPSLPDNRPCVEYVYADVNDTVYAVINTAHWINFEANDDETGGGATYTSPVYVTQDQLPSKKKPEDPTRRGWTFKGWYLESACTTPFNWEQIITSDKLLYAKWERIENSPFTVVIWKQRASDEVNASEKTYDYEASYSLTGPTDGEFRRSMISDYLNSLGAGFKNPTYKVVKGTTGQEINNIRAAGDTVVNIYHDRQSYTLTFRKDWNGKVYKTITALYEHIIADQFPIKVNNNESYRWDPQNSSTFNQVLVFIDKMPKENITFYRSDSDASLKTMYYKVQPIDGVQGAYGSYEIRSTVAAKYNFITEAEDFINLHGFQKDTSDPKFVNGKALNNGGTEITFYYTRNKHDIIFKNGTDIKKQITGIHYEKPLAGFRSQAPTKDEMPTVKGFEFKGWFLDANGQQEFNWNDTMPDNNVVLYAYYKPLEYKVHLEPNGGTYTSGTDFTLKYDSKTGKFEEISRATLYNSISRDGFELVGWFIDDGGSCSEPYGFGQPSGDINLIAKWRNPGKVKVIYRAGANGTGGVPEDNYLYEPSSTVVVGASATPKDKYTFIGWTIANDTTHKIYYPNNCFEITPDYVQGTGEVKFVYMDAVFEKTGAIGDDALTTITYHPNGGTGSDYTVPGPLRINEKVTLLSAEDVYFSRENYEFIGWAKTAGTEKPDFSAGQVVGADNDDPYPNDLYAIWRIKKVGYTIKYYKGSLDATNFIDEVVKDPVELGSAEASITLGTEDLNAGKPEGFRDGVQQGDIPFIVTADGANVINVVYPSLSITVTIKGNTAEHTYTGEDQTVSGYEIESILDENGAAVTGFDESNVTLKEGAVAIATRKEAGTTRMGLSSASFMTIGTSFTDVTFAVTDGYITINKVGSVVVTITGHNNEASYDGTEHKVEGYEVSINSDLYKETDFSFSGTAQAAQTEVGTKKMGLTAEMFHNDNENFTDVIFNVIDGYQTIKPADVTVSITGHHLTKDFDGTEYTATGYEVVISNPLYKESDFTFSGTAKAQRTEAGTTRMNLSEDQFTNTNDNFGTVTFVITDGYVTVNPIDVTVTIKGHNNTADYDAAEHKAEGYDVEISNPLYTEADFTFSGTAEAARTEAGTTNMNLAKDQFTNNNTNFESVTFNVTDGYQTINPIDVTVTITGHHEVATYDKAEHKAEGYDVEISNPLYKETDFTFSGTAEAARTEVGTTNMNLAKEQFANTNTNFGTVNFEVTDGYVTIAGVNEIVVTITGAHDSRDYDREEHTVAGYDVEISNPLYTEADFSFSGTATASQTEVGKMMMGLDPTQFTNNNTNFGSVTFNVTDGYQEILPINVTITVTGHTDSKEYDGEEHGVEGYEIEANNDFYLINEFLEFTGTAQASRTDVGKTKMGITPEMFVNHDTNFGNVTVDVTDGYQEITPKKVEITVTGHSATLEYNGKEQSVTGFDMTIPEGVAITKNDVKFAGSAVATGSGIGTYKMGLTKDQFSVTDENYDVTFIVNDGILTITGNNGQFSITISTDSATRTYSGETFEVTGYTVSGNANVQPAMNADFMSAEFEAVPLGSDKVTVNGVTFTVSGISVDTKGREVGTYDIAILGTPVITDSFGNDVTAMFSITRNTGTLSITPMAITVTSGSATRAYNGKALTNEEVTAVPGWGIGDNVTYNVTGKQTAIGKSKNTFEIVASEEVLRNYDITKVEGTLEVTGSGEPTPPAPPAPIAPVAPAAPTPTPGSAPTVINDNPTPLAATPAATPTGEGVLGARRETNTGAVLGARRGTTDDETNTTARAFAIIVAAAAALSFIILGRKKHEEEEES